MLIKTKLKPASLRSGLLFRKKLVDRLGTATGSSLVLISGPAGSGKTSLASQWIEQERRRVAWYCLDDKDNTPNLFFRYLLTTLIMADKQLKNTLEHLLADGRALSSENVIPHLIDALFNLSYTIQLVLDDFHQITNSDIHDALACLLRYMPDCLQIVILSRYTLPPLVDAAVVKKDRMEITADELKFTETESVALFKNAISNGFTVHQVRYLHRHVEGWAAGLQLISLLIRSKGAHLDLSDILNQTHEQMANYLFHDILRMQSQNMQEFILSTVLLDRLSPELCVAVTGMQDAAKILARLESMNLFLIPLDNNRKWYRYHHMFSGVIRHRIAGSNPDAVTAILIKAAKWLARNNHMEDALHCAFQTKDFESAADFIEDHIAYYWQALDLSAEIHWISKLPESVLHRRPLLRLQQCGFFTILMELSDVKEILSSIENNGEPDFSRYTGDKLAFCQDLFACFKYTLRIFHVGDTSAIEQFQALRNKISLHNPLLSGYIERHIVSTLISKGNLSLSERFFSRLTKVTTATHNQFLRKKIHHAQVMALIARHRGNLNRAEEIISQTLEFFHRQGNDHTQMTFSLYRYLGIIYYQQNRLEKARECAARTVVKGTKYCEKFGLFDEIMAGNELCLQLHLAAGEKEQAAQCIGKIRAYAIKVGVAGLSDSAELCAARLAIDLGNLAAATLWSQRRNLQPDEPFSLLFAMECLTQARLHYAKMQYGNAEQLLTILRNRCIKRYLWELVLHIDILESAIYHAMNQQQKAKCLLKKALIFSEIEGYIRPFVNDFKRISPVLKGIVKQSPRDLSFEHIEKVLAACGMTLSRLTASCVCDGVAPFALTQRESEILQMVAQGFQNKEIAQKAFIAITTVKSHVTNIMAKLNVKNRTQAILKAREMNLIKAR